jgi:hypothetical protein
MGQRTDSWCRRGAFPMSLPNDDPRRVLESLTPLFAPYCGGIGYRAWLEPALQQLLEGSWSGERLLSGGRSHRFSFSWQGEPAPLEPMQCQLRFPALPQVAYDFSLPAYQLVYWLMQRQGSQLPDGFWRWLLTGEIPAAQASAGSEQGSSAA